MHWSPVNAIFFQGMIEHGTLYDLMSLYDVPFGPLSAGVEAIHVISQNPQSGKWLPGMRMT